MLFILLLVLQIEAEILFSTQFQEPTNGNSEGWDIIHAQDTNFITYCLDSYIVGGPNVFGQQSAVTNFFVLPPHSDLKISFKYYMIDEWEIGSQMYFYIDEAAFQKTNFYNIQTAYSNLCGGLHYDQTYDIDIIVKHNANTVFFMITSDLTQDASTASWGFRNFRIFLNLCPAGCLFCTSNNSQQECLSWVQIAQSLYENDPNLMFSDGWSLTDGFDGQMICSSIFSFCGYLNCGARTTFSKLFDLPFHSSLKIRFKYLKVGNWGLNNNAQLYIDTLLRWNQPLGLYENQYLTSACGSSALQDLVVNVEITIPHSQLETTILFCNTLDDLTCIDQSFGLRDIEIFIQQQICGDMVVQENEQCDDGNLIPFDGCFSCFYSCPQECQACLRGECLQIENAFIQNAFQNTFQSNCQQSLSNSIEALIECNSMQEQSNSFFELLQCPENCLSCQLNQCQICSIGYLLQHNVCINKLVSCEDSCAVCQDGACLLCKQQSTLILGLCQSDCGDLGLYSTEDQCKLQESLEICPEQCKYCVNGICLECNFGYDLINSNCVGICGDGILQDNEECDDGNQISYDGCYNCQYQCYQGCRSCEKGLCLDVCDYGYYFLNDGCATICGDLIVKGTEVCDDGNQQKHDGCYQCEYSCPLNCSTCLIGQCSECELGYYLNYDSNQCLTECGDGQLSDQEQCDDGNLQNFDGCSSNCIIEVNWLCIASQECQYTEYPKSQADFTLQQNQYQYVSLTFSQSVASKSQTNYSQTIQLSIDNLSKDLYIATIYALQAAEQNFANVQYLIEIEFLCSLDYYPFLEIELTEQLYNVNDSPLQNLIIFVKLQLPNYLSQQEQQVASEYQTINEVSIAAALSLSLTLALFGSSASFYGVLNALQEQSYLRFINVVYPQNLMIYFESSQLISLQPILNFIQLSQYEGTLLQYPYYQSQEKFQFYSINSDVGENIRSEVVVFATLFITWIASIVVMRLVIQIEEFELIRKSPTIARKLQHIKFKLQCFKSNIRVNGVKDTLVASTWDLCFMSLLELSSYRVLNSFRAYVCRSLAIGILVCGTFQMLIFLKGQKSWKKENYQCFWLQKVDLFLALKKCSIIAILVLMQQQQELQTICLLLVNMFYLVYLVNFCITSEKYEYFKAIILQISTTLFTLSTILNWNTIAQYLTYNSRVLIGWFQMSILAFVVIIFAVVEFWKLAVTISEIIISARKKQIQSQLLQDKISEPQEQGQNMPPQTIFSRRLFSSKVHPQQC